MKNFGAPFHEGVPVDIRSVAFAKTQTAWLIKEKLLREGVSLLVGKAKNFEFFCLTNLLSVRYTTIDLVI
jgi:hypothetical protein